MISNNTKRAITRIVNDYRKLYPDEYAAVIEQLRLTRAQNKDDLASTGHDGVIHQKMYEIPATLYDMLLARLKETERKEFQDQELGGPRWFAQTFKEFAIAEKI